MRHWKTRAAIIILLQSYFCFVKCAFVRKGWICFKFKSKRLFLVLKKNEKPSNGRQNGLIFEKRDRDANKNFFSTLQNVADKKKLKSERLDFEASFYWLQ